MVNFDDELSELCIDLISEQNTPSKEDSMSIDIIENGQSNNATSQVFLNSVISHNISTVL